MAVISRAERDRIFGPPGQVDRITVVTPWGIKVSCHRLIAAVFLQACRDAYTHSPWRPQRIDSYANRTIRGSTSPSLHAYALAHDFFSTPPNVPPPGGVWTPDDPVTVDFAEHFTRRGFRWGATFTRVDLPHIEWPGGLPSTTATEATPVPITTQEYPMAGLDQLDDQKGAVRALFRTFLLRNPNNQTELDLHVLALARDGYEARVVAFVESAEGRAVLDAERRAVGL